VRGKHSDVQCMQQIVQGADFCVCLLAEGTTTSEGFLTDFVRRLYPLLQQQVSMRVFLFQVSRIKGICAIRVDVLSYTLLISLPRSGILFMFITSPRP
jgi:hypothetical protein